MQQRRMRDQDFAERYFPTIFVDKIVSKASLLA